MGIGISLLVEILRMLDSSAISPFDPVFPDMARIGAFAFTPMIARDHDASHTHPLVAIL